MTEIQEANQSARSSFCRPAIRLSGGKRIIFYAVLGDRGPWLIANSLGNNTEIYIPPMYRQISLDCRIILVRWPQTDKLEAAVTDNIAVLDAIGVSSATWYGTSVGGAIAQTANIISPKHVSKMILANTALPVSWAVGLARFTVFLMGLFPENYLRKKLLQAGESTANANELEAASIFLKKKDICNWLKWAADFHGIDIKQMAKRNREKPIMILETDNDPGVPASHRKKLRLFYTDATVTCFEGGGHFPQALFPEKYEQQIAGFLTRTDGE